MAYYMTTEYRVNFCGLTLPTLITVQAAGRQGINTNRDNKNGQEIIVMRMRETSPCLKYEAMTR